MLLRVDFADFPEAIRRELGHSTAYVRATSAGTVVTGGLATAHIVVVAEAHLSVEETRDVLKAAGLVVHNGVWCGDEDLLEASAAAEELHVAAIAYKSVDATPGIWVDAFPFEPTPVQALRAMYDEFTENGEVHEVTFDEFVRMAQPNLVTVSPAEIAGFARSKEVE